MAGDDMGRRGGYLNGSLGQQGCNSIDILDGLNLCLNPSLNRRPIWRLPKRIHNPCLNLRLNSSLKFQNVY